jgi:hypothetical protein
VAAEATRATTRVGGSVSGVVELPRCLYPESSTRSCNMRHHIVNGKRDLLARSAPGVLVTPSPPQRARPLINCVVIECSLIRILRPGLLMIMVPSSAADSKERYSWLGRMRLVQGLVHTGQGALSR